MLSYLNLLYIAAGRFHNLYEVLTYRIGDVNTSAYGIHINGNEFFGCLVNEDLLENPYVISLLNDLMNILRNKLPLNTGSLQHFLVTSYDDQRKCQMARNLRVHPLNVSHVQLICKVFLDNASFTDYTLVPQRITALIGLLI